jgi:hypothetical protein
LLSKYKEVRKKNFQTTKLTKAKEFEEIFKKLYDLKDRYKDHSTIVTLLIDEIGLASKNSLRYLHFAIESTRPD